MRVSLVADAKVACAYHGCLLLVDGCLLLTNPLFVLNCVHGEKKKLDDGSMIVREARDSLFRYI